MYVCCSVCSVLLQGGANLNSQDLDGWTPLHAAAHWGQKEACEMLVEEFCDMDMKNYVVGNCHFINLKMFVFPVSIATVNKVYTRALNFQSRTVWVWVWSQPSLCGIYGGWLGIGTDFSSISIFLHHCHSTDAPYKFIHHTVEPAQLTFTLNKTLKRYINMCHVVCDDKNSLLIGTESVQTVANLPHSTNYDVSLGYQVVR